MSDVHRKPLVGMQYEDARGRVLKVIELSIPDRKGREVRGLMKLPNTPVKFDYSCMLHDWEHIWRDKAPPAKRAQMTHG